MAAGSRGFSMFSRCVRKSGPVMACLIVSSLSGFTDPPPNAGRPSGIALVDLPTQENNTPLSAPFDAATGQWLSGASEILSWDEDQQVWESYTFDGSKWINGSGKEFDHPQAGQVVVPRNQAGGGLRIMLSGNVPLDESRAQLMVPGLNLAGDPYNLQTGPLSSTWHILPGEEDRLVETANPAGDWVENPSAPQITPIGISADGTRVEFSISSGGYESSSLGIFSVVLLNGQPWNREGFWVYEDQVQGSSEAISWSENLPSFEGVSVIKLYVVAPVETENQEGRASPLFAFGLHPLDYKLASGELLSSQEYAQLELLIAQRATLNELRALRELEDRFRPGAIPYLQVNNAQEERLQAHARKSRIMKANGYGHISELPLELKAAIQEQR